jgi:hypothetical protein
LIGRSKVLAGLGRVWHLEFSKMSGMELLLRCTVKYAGSFVFEMNAVICALGPGSNGYFGGKAANDVTRGLTLSIAPMGLRNTAGLVLSFP